MWQMFFPAINVSRFIFSKLQVIKAITFLCLLVTYLYSTTVLSDEQDMSIRDMRIVSLGGEKQRVHLARVIAQLWNKEQSQIRYLLLDEPTSALDLSHQHKTLSIARAFTREQNVAALIVLHDLNLAALYVDKLAMMYEGKIVAYGTPQEVLKADTIEKVFDYPVIVNTHPLQAQIPLVITSGFSDIKMDIAI